MSKRNIIFICVAVAVIIVVAFAVYFIVKPVNDSKNSDNEKIIIEKYDEDFNVEKTVEITNKKQIKQLKDICENPSLEQDDETPYLAIRNDVKIDLGNGKFLMIQLGLDKYCYYEDANTDTQLVIKMPEGLLEKVNDILAKN